MVPERERSGSSGQSASTATQEQPSLGQRMMERLRRPEALTDLLLAGKAVVAGTAAWAIAVGLLDSEVAFMAPWTALLTVHATVHRSLTHGAQTTASSAIGMGLAFVIIHFLGINVWTFALALLVGLMGARLTWIRDEGVAIATTSIFIFTADEPMFFDRAMELLVGVGVGIVVNFLVVPPLRDRQAGRHVDSINRRMGDVLIDMSNAFSGEWDSDQADAWLADTESMSAELDSAWQTVRLARESKRSNPRSMSRRVNKNQPEEVSYEEILSRVDEGISHLRNLMRTLREASHELSSWDPRFREGWVGIAHDVGVAVANPDKEVGPLYDRLRDLSSEMSKADNLAAIEWPTYGAMLSSLRHIVTIVDDVASAREARET